MNAGIANRIPSRFSRQTRIAAAAALKAERIIAQCYRKEHTMRYKKDGTVVTDVDLAAENVILSILKKEFPSHTIYSEEAGIDRHDSPYTWTVDPLDGTMNFAMKNPFFNTAISLSKDNVPILGVVYGPLFDEVFIAEKSKGAVVNGYRIHVSTNKNAKRATIGFCHGSGNAAMIERAIRFYSKLKRTTSKTRQFGSAALELCYVACGRIDAFEMSDLHAYDVAAGVIMVQEAGGIVADFAGKRFTLKSRDVLATNGCLHRKLLGILTV